MIQVLAGASFDEKEVLSWIEMGKQVDHEIRYEEIPITGTSDSGGMPREVLVYFDDVYHEGWDKDFQWMDPVGRKAVAPKKYVGIERPCPEVEGTKSEDGYVGDGLFLWRVPCPWTSQYLLAPFTAAGNENINEGRPWTV
ncbi:hypothetical protein ACWIB8_07065 [Corynebacterium flavescens]